MNIKLFIMLVALILIASNASASIQVGKPSPSSVVIKNPTVSTTGGGANVTADVMNWSLYPAISNVNISGYNLTDIDSISMRDNSTFQAGTFISSRSLLQSLISPGFRGYSIGANSSTVNMYFQPPSTSVTKYSWFISPQRIYLADSLSNHFTSDGVFYEYNGTDFVLDVRNATNGQADLYGNYLVTGGLNATGKICDSVGCIGASTSLTNVAFLNNSQTFNQVNSFATNTGKIRIGNDSSVADRLNIYADSSSGRVIFDESEMDFDGTLEIQPTVEFGSGFYLGGVTSNWNIFPSTSGVNSFTTIGFSDSDGGGILSVDNLAGTATIRLRNNVTNTQFVTFRGGESTVIDYTYNGNFDQYSFRNSGSGSTRETRWYGFPTGGSLGYLGMKAERTGSTNFYNMNTSFTAISFQQMIKLKANTTGVTCGSDTAGAIYYNGAAKKHYGCDSTTWNALY